MGFESIEYIKKRIAAGNDLSPKHGEVLCGEIEKLRSTLKEVSGCQTEHKTKKLCEGCLISISRALEG